MPCQQLMAALVLELSKANDKCGSAKLLWAWQQKLRIFDGVNSSMCFVKSLFLNELSCWERAGAKHLASFGLPAIMSRV
jgi:hypothetical protein